MQNNFECILKLIVVLTFLMCVVCSHYLYSFLMFTSYYYFHIVFFCSHYQYTFLMFTSYYYFQIMFFFVFLNERHKKERKEKERNKENKES